MAKSRCQNLQLPCWPDYGGRGIEFRFTSFEEFYICLGPRPPGYTLDRIDNDGHYEKGNVRWATRQEQNLNKRLYKNSTTGIRTITVINPRGKYKTKRYVVRTYLDGKRKEIYKGPSLQDARRIHEELTRLQKTNHY